VGFISASESHCKTNLNKTIDEAIADFAQVVPIANQWGIGMHGGLATAFGCPFEGDVPINNILKIVGAIMPMVFVALGLATQQGWQHRQWSHARLKPYATNSQTCKSRCIFITPAAWV
jgi:hydroxymethylglutaryl-CoA lyase